MAAAGTRLSPSQIETVVAAASTGAAWAFEALYRDFAPAVVGYLRLQGASDPDDISSEVFLGAFRGITRFRGGHAEFKTWLFSIAHRRLIDDRRRRSRQESRMARAELAVETCTDARSDPGAALDTGWVIELCHRLAPDQRDVVLLRLVADLTLEETARALGKSVGAVKSLQHRALRSLRVLLAAEMPSEGVSR